MTSEFTRFHPAIASADPLTQAVPLWHWAAKMPDGVGSYDSYVNADTAERAIAWARKNYPQLSAHKLVG